MLNPTTEAGLLVRPDLALMAASAGSCGGRQHRAAKDLAQKAPCMGRPAPHNGLVSSTVPAWPLKGPLSLSTSFEERPPTIWNPTGHSSPLAVLLLPGLLDPHSSPTKSNTGIGIRRGIQPRSIAPVPSRSRLSGLRPGSRGG